MVRLDDNPPFMALFCGIKHCERGKSLGLVEGAGPEGANPVAQVSAKKKKKKKGNSAGGHSDKETQNQPFCRDQTDKGECVRWARVR